MYGRNGMWRSCPRVTRPNSVTIFLGVLNGSVVVRQLRANIPERIRGITEAASSLTLTCWQILGEETQCEIGMHPATCVECL
jgi:hypothetical protein